VLPRLLGVILGRRDPDAAADVGTPADDPAEVGKGRPTPKRATARQARRTATPRNRKEAAQFRRERLREERGKTRKALQTGDERNLPLRDAGPERRLARDIVDSRFTLGQALFGLMFVALVLSVIKAGIINLIASLVILVMFIALMLDGIRNGKRAKEAVVERFGENRAAGIRGYAMSRALLPKRFRRPPPKVNRGDDVRR
jgi:hypothetical protein